MQTSLSTAIILGIVQGLTEFFPVSSSAHLIIAPWVLGVADPGLAFDVILHLGTLLALFIYFIGDWMRVFSQGVASVVERKIGYNPDRQMFWYLIWGTVPAGVAGLLFHDLAETKFRDPLIIAMTLSMVGLLLYWIDSRQMARRHLDELTLKDVIFIGIAQAFAIVPGVSRSGITMLAGRYLGFNREAAARFSFMLSFPIILAASLHELPRWLELVQGDIPWGLLGAGIGASFFSGMFAIHFLLIFLKSSDFRFFAWYRILLAGFLVFWSILK